MSPKQPSYRTVLHTPHVARSFLPSIIGRLSLATSGLALILVIEQATGSFAIAGTVTAVFGIANVVATPWRARLLDRRGQALVLFLLGLGHAVSLIGLGLAADAGMLPLLCLSVFAGLSSPPFGATMRVVWASVLPPGGLRTRGFSLDAVAEEVTFAVGPLAAASLALVVSPFASLLMSACFVAIGTALFVISPLSRQQSGSSNSDRQKAGPSTSPLKSRGFPPIILAMTASGVTLGCIEIAAPAIRIAESNTLLSGVLLALFAGASAVGGLIYGGLRLQIKLERQLLSLTLVILAVTGATGLIGGTSAALIGFFLSGLCLAPLLIVGYLAADDRTDPRVRTEASSWINTAVNLGAALGAAIFGSLTDAIGPGPALTASAVLSAIIITICTPLLLRPRHAS